MSVDVEDLTRALRSYMDAEYEERKARDAYEGRSWGWAGAGLISERDHAAKRFSDRLDAYIDERINIAVARNGCKCRGEA